MAEAMPLENGLTNAIFWCLQTSNREEVDAVDAVDEVAWWTRWTVISWLTI